MLCPMLLLSALRREKGSSTLEGILVFPLVLMILVLLLFGMTYLYNMFNTMNSGAFTLRNVAYGWYEGKDLYDDVLTDYNRSEKVQKKLVQTKAFYWYAQNPSLVRYRGVSFDLVNHLLFKTLVMEGNFAQNRLFQMRLAYPLYFGSVFLRNYDYTLEIFEDAFRFLSENLPDSQRVYVVDDSMDPAEYDRVYHLYRDCSYVDHGIASVSTVGAKRALGFRVCRVCLARKTGMD